MNIQERLVSLSKFNAGLNMVNGNFIVTITFDPNWDVIEPTGDDVVFERDERNPNMYYYAAPMSMDINVIFSSIDETIEYNRELERKVELFTKKHAELVELFKNETYENLKTLTFVIPEAKPVTKRGRKKKEKDETVQENVEVNQVYEDKCCKEETEGEMVSDDRGTVVATFSSEIDNKIAAAMNKK